MNGRDEIALAGWAKANALPADVAGAIFEIVESDDDADRLMVDLRDGGYAALVGLYEAWCGAKGFPCYAAQELMAEGFVDGAAKHWLKHFVAVWDHWEARP